MEKQPKLSLEEMALRKSVVHFWSETDILTLIEEFPRKNMRGKEQLWQEKVEDKVKDKISKLVFPEKLKRRMNLVVKPIGLQIPQWEKFMRQCLCDSRENLDMHFLKQLCWTSAGALDYKKTAEKLVSDQALDVVKRFKIACGHCLVDSLPVLWKDLPEEYKSGFSKTNNRFLLMLDEKFWQNYWVLVLKGEEYKLLEIHVNFYLYALEISAQCGNKAATEYFFEKLANEERDSVLFLLFPDILEAFFSGPFFLDSPSPSYFPQEQCIDVIFYLLSQMTPEQQMQVFRECPGHLFRMYLHWPWQDLFLDKTDLIWKFIPEGSTYDNLLHHIRRKIVFSDYYFPELFQEFFCRSPSDFRKHFVNQECRLGKTLFSKFINNEDKETIKAILRNIDVEDRLRLVSCFGVFKCLDSILGCKEQLVELCVRESYASKKDRYRLKDVYMRFFTENVTPVDFWRKRKWQRFFKSLDKTDASVLKKRIVRRVSDQS